MELEVSVDIAAPPDRVWQVMTDVERWPEWTESITLVEKVDPGPLRVGSRVRITQPRIPRTAWLVTAIEPGQSFEWEAASPAMKTVAGHEITPLGDASRVRLWVRQSGIFGLVMGWWVKSLTRRYLQMEAAGLKARAENSQSGNAEA